MGSFDIITLVFLGLAVFVIFKLRSVLGERTGAEPPPPFEALRRDSASAARDEKIITIPPREIEGGIPGEPPVPAAFRWEGYAKEGSALATGFDEIAALDPTFQPATFAAGAKAAYEMIVTAFNQGDRKTLKGLLSRENFDSFSQDITDREARGESVQSNFVSIDKAEITQAASKGTRAAPSSKAAWIRSPALPTHGPSPAIPARAIRTGDSWPRASRRILKSGERRYQCHADHARIRLRRSACTERRRGVGRSRQVVG